jgi:glycine cleavage system H protein
MPDTPDYLQYTTTHTWVEIIEESTIRVGLTDVAQQEPGDIVYVELPELEREFTQGDECVIIESAKTTSEIYCPASGTMIAINLALEASPGIINMDPYGGGWIFQMEIVDDSNLDDLIDADTYNELTEED